MLLLLCTSITKYESEIGKTTYKVNITIFFLSLFSFFFVYPTMSMFICTLSIKSFSPPYLCLSLSLESFPENFGRERYWMKKIQSCVNKFLVRCHPFRNRAAFYSLASRKSNYLQMIDHFDINYDSAVATTTSSTVNDH